MSFSKICQKTRLLKRPIVFPERRDTVTAERFPFTFRLRVENIGLDSLVYTHSFRIGGATLAYKQKYSETQIENLGRWRSSAFTKYIRTPKLNFK